VRINGATRQTNATVNSPYGLPIRWRACQKRRRLPPGNSLVLFQACRYMSQLILPSNFWMTPGPWSVSQTPFASRRRQRHGIFGAICTASQKKPLAPAQPRPISNLPAITHLSISPGIKATIFRSQPHSGSILMICVRRLMRMANSSLFRDMNGRAIPGWAVIAIFIFQTKGGCCGGHHMR